MDNLPNQSCQRINTESKYQSTKEEGDGICSTSNMDIIDNILAAFRKIPELDFFGNDDFVNSNQEYQQCKYTEPEKMNTHLAESDMNNPRMDYSNENAAPYLEQDIRSNILQQGNPHCASPSSLQRNDCQYASDDEEGMGNYSHGQLLISTLHEQNKIQSHASIEASLSDEYVTASDSNNIYKFFNDNCYLQSSHTSEKGSFSYNRAIDKSSNCNILHGQTDEHPQSILHDDEPRNNTLIGIPASESGKRLSISADLFVPINIKSVGNDLLSPNNNIQKKLHNRRFICENCGKGFHLKHHLVAHNRIHTGYKPFTCPECGKTFNVSGNLTVHRRIHTGEKPFICKKCGNAFRYSSYLTKHRCIHTG